MPSNLQKEVEQRSARDASKSGSGNYQKEAQQLARNARKLLHRKRDLLPDNTIAEMEIGIQRLETAIRDADESAVNAASDHLDKEFGRFAPHREDAAWRENCEVLLVAIVLAIGIRAYFLQPFKIPTGSMQPTLNGIIAHPRPAAEPLPNIFTRIFGFVFEGRTYVDAVSEVDDEVIAIRPEKRLFFLNYSRLVCASGKSYSVYAPQETLSRGSAFGSLLRSYRAGEVIVHGYVDTGDQVFVDKFTYNFRRPQRGDVFVFNTGGIGGIHMSDPEVRSEFYIKRLAGTPGDKLQVKEPQLYINDHLASEKGFARVMTRQNGYRGYSNDKRFVYLTDPTEDFLVPPKSYFAMGDNSFNSSDSRAWGRVPAENVVGRGLFVYYPFTRHWGPIN